jgi:hypothetical protein
MAKLVISGLEETEKTLLEMADIPDEVIEKALGEMGKIGVNAVKSTGAALGIYDGESRVHILDKVKLAKIAKTPGGGFTEVYFSGMRKRGNTVTANSLIAFQNEYGNRHQQARPFVRLAAAQYGDQIAAPGEKIIGDWFEHRFVE